MSNPTLTAFAAALFVFAGSACDRSPTFPYESEVIEGFITAVDLDRVSPYPPRILIEEQPHYGTDTPLVDPHVQGSKIWFAIWEASIFEREHADGSISRIRFEDVGIGSRARAWAGGVLFDSYPQQTAAARIRVISPGSD